MSGWGDPETAAYYEAFCSHHPRYAVANRELVDHAQIAPHMRILDVAAGTGRTTEAALRSLGDSCSVLCFEPFAAMRDEGMRRITDPRVEWVESLPAEPDSFDRILCGAAIWQLHPLPQTFATLARLLRPGGALCFNIPALYLLEPDEPGGGSDPYLLSLQESLAASLPLTPAQPDPSDETPASISLSRDSISSMLTTAGLHPQEWSFRIRITQTAYANWLKIPVLTDPLLGHFSPAARAAKIDVALKSVDTSSWKWERWRGWTAWKEPSQ